MVGTPIHSIRTDTYFLFSGLVGVSVVEDMVRTGGEMTQNGMKDGVEMLRRIMIDYGVMIDTESALRSVETETVQR